MLDKSFKTVVLYIAALQAETLIYLLQVLQIAVLY